MCWSVTTEKGVTSEPVPLVVGMATMSALEPRVGTLYTRFRMSIKRMASPSKRVSGHSYMSHMTLAASMGDLWDVGCHISSAGGFSKRSNNKTHPPPNATMTSGLKERSCLRPASTVAKVGSGSTSKNTWVAMPSSSRVLETVSHMPRSYSGLSVTIKARLRPARSRSANSRQPRLK